MSDHNFSKQDSLIAKGIAIILMLNYHLYNFEDQVIAMAVDYRPLSLSAFMALSGFGNICVAVFVLISSYGITKGLMRLSGEQDNIGVMCRQAAFRAGRLILNFAAMYLSIVVVFYKHLDFVRTYGAGWQGRLLQLVDMLGLANLFKNLPTMNETWWYMELAFMIIALVPFLYLLVRKTGAAILFPAFILPFLGEMNYDVKRYYMVVVLGVVLASRDYLGPVFDWKAPRIVKAFVGVALLAACVVFRCNPAVKDYFWWIVDGPIALLILWFSREVVAGIPVVRSVLIFLGRHSMNMFLVHMFFYLAIYREFIYSFRYAGLILLVLVLVSLGYSVALEWVKKGIKQFIRRTDLWH